MQFDISVVVFNRDTTVRGNGRVNAISFYNQGDCNVSVQGRVLLPFMEWTPFVNGPGEIDTTNGWLVSFDTTTGGNNRQLVVSMKTYK